jgi:hypothetical protein
MKTPVVYQNTGIPLRHHGKYASNFALMHESKEMSIMKAFSKIFGFMLLILSVASAAAGQYKDGIHGMPWGSAITEYGQLTKVRGDGSVAYYVNSNMLYQVASQDVPAVVYGAYQGKLFAAFIMFQTPDQFQYMIQHFTTKLGEPKVTFTSASRQSVYRWKNGNVKIKMKKEESRPDFKMGLYFMPLSDQANQERLENPPAEIFENLPSKEGQELPSAPLVGHD